jgi:hypothetical protein
MPRDVEMQHTSAVVADYEETVANPKCKGWNREEVHRHDGFPMIPQEGEPPFGSPGNSRGSAHSARDRSFTDIETQHQEFAMNARRAAGWVLRHHPEDQISDFFLDPVSSSRLVRLRDQAPIQLEACAVLPTDGLRAHQDERTLPARPDPTSPNPGQLVDSGHPRSAVMPLEHQQLLPEDQVLQEKIATGAEQAASKPKINQRRRNMN